MSQAGQRSRLRLGQMLLRRSLQSPRPLSLARVHPPRLSSPDICPRSSIHSLKLGKLPGPQSDSKDRTKLPHAPQHTQHSQAAVPQNTQQAWEQVHPGPPRWGKPHRPGSAGSP